MKLHFACYFNKIYCNPNHALEAALPQVHVLDRLSHLAVSIHSRYLSVPKCRTVQFGRLFVPSCVQLWNSLGETCFAGDGVAAFMSRSIVPFSLIDLHFHLLLPFPIISCLLDISLHVGFNFIGFCQGKCFIFLLMLLAPVLIITFN